jgi:hypothetical protein
MGQAAQAGARHQMTGDPAAISVAMERYLATLIDPPGRITRSITAMRVSSSTLCINASARA